MKHFLLISTIFLSLSSMAFAADYPVNLEGKYDCTGQEVDTNENYTCVTTLKKTGQTYSANSTCSDGSTYIGTGVYDQAKHNFSLGFINPKKSEETGVAVADVKKNYAMTSTWTYLYKTNIAHASCTKRTNAA